MGRPQNLVSRSLSIRSCFTYLVVAGSGKRGMTLSSRTWNDRPSFEAASIVISLGVL
jgi:hypothetical protein